MYTRGETRTLFDTLQTLMKIVGDLKVYDADFKKVYVLHFSHHLCGLETVLSCEKCCFLLRWRDYGCLGFSGYVIYGRDCHSIFEDPQDVLKRACCDRFLYRILTGVHSLCFCDIMPLLACESHRRQLDEQ